MEMIKLGSAEELRSFYPSVYGKDPGFKDNKSSLLPLVCGRRSSFYQNSRQEIIAVVHNGKRLCQCVLIHHKNAGAAANIAFFEALPDSGEAVAHMLEYAEIWAAAEKCTRLVAGMDGHLNYSLGFSLENTAPPSFGESYNPSYYAGYFSGFSEVRLSCFQDEASLVRQRIDDDCSRIIGRCPQYSFEPARINDRNLKRYTDLSNTIFECHDFYFKREYQEDAELLGQMKLILDRGALLFIKEGQTDIGLVFYYPDFNELVRPGRGFGILSAVKRHLRFSPARVKMAEIGVLPAYQNKGVVTLAFQQAMNTALKNYPDIKTIISSWIIDTNTKSSLFTRRYTKHKGGSFVVYEKNISGQTP